MRQLFRRPLPLSTREERNMDHLNSSMPMMMNEMYFHFSKTVSHLLFESWNINSAGDIIGAMVFCFILAVLYEGLKTVREWLMSCQHKLAIQRTSTRYYSSHDVSSEDNASLVYERPPPPPIKHKRLKIWLMRGIQSVLRTVEIGMAYILMFLAMTFNGWLFLSVCVGAGTGNFIFSHFRPSIRESQDHCG